MVESLKLIWSKIPQKRVTVVLLFVAGVLSQHVFDVYFNAAKLLAVPRIIPSLVWSGHFLFVYYLSSYIVLSLVIISNRIELKKELPYKYVSIGKPETADGLVAVDIQARIVLNDQMQPDIQNFFNRIILGQPYCPKCSRPLEVWRFRTYP